MPIVTPKIGATAYNDFDQFARFSYNCISHLINSNELIWKLLKYSEPDAWQKNNLTREEKVELIYKGQADASEFHVFMDTKQPDVYTLETTILRISPYMAYGRNRTVGYVEIAMEVFSHHKINHLSNYQTRVDTIIAELFRTFNGADVGGIGLLSFNQMADKGARLFSTGQIPFGGKTIIFASATA